MKKINLSNEFKIGLLLIVTLAIILLFTRMMGVSNPFIANTTLYLNYNFAGGIESGSPVRLAGIKVGKVEKISFVENKLPDPQVQLNEVPTPLQIEISISHEAADFIRTDSKFFINLAGLIGERYIEITPGTKNAPKIADGDHLRGIDPPRIDQLISQSFNLAGKIKEILESNEVEITKTIKLLSDLSSN